MRSPLSLSALDRLLRPRARHANDASAAAELNWSNFDADWPPGLELQWLGTAGFRFAYEGVVLLVDPYLSRPGLGDIVRRGRLHSRAAAVRRYVPAADAVLVGHTHFDHALDVPTIAEQTGCKVYGSSSLRHLMGLAGRPELAIVVEPYRVFEVGPFRVTFVPSKHAKLLLGLRIPADGEMSCCHLDEMTADQYRCGQVYAIHIEVAGASFYHQGSADLIDDAVRHRGVDYFLCGIAGRGYTPRYAARVLGALSPRVVVPTHHDDFLRPLDAPMAFSFNVNFGGFVEEVHRVSADFRVRALAPLQTIG